LNKIQQRDSETRRTFGDQFRNRRRFSDSDSDSDSDSNGFKGKVTVMIFQFFFLFSQFTFLFFFLHPLKCNRSLPIPRHGFRLLQLMSLLPSGVSIIPLSFGGIGFATLQNPSSFRLLGEDPSMATPLGTHSVYLRGIHDLVKPPGKLEKDVWDGIWLFSGNPAGIRSEKGIIDGWGDSHWKLNGFEIEQWIRLCKSLFCSDGIQIRFLGFESSRFLYKFFDCIVLVGWSDRWRSKLLKAIEVISSWMKLTWFPTFFNFSLNFNWNIDVFMFVCFCYRGKWRKG